METSMKGHVQIAFERREGIPLLDWVALHGAKMTAPEAARYIGYECPKALKWLVRAHLPGFTFARRQNMYTARQLNRAIAQKAAGKTWAELTQVYGQAIQGAVRRHKARARK